MVNRLGICLVRHLNTYIRMILVCDRHPQLARRAKLNATLSGEASGLLGVREIVFLNPRDTPREHET